MSDQPPWWVAYVATVARETGWSAEYILWELPYALGLGIEHAAAIHHGETMVYTHGAGRGNAGRAEMHAQLEAARARYGVTRESD